MRPDVYTTRMTTEHNNPYIRTVYMRRFPAANASTTINNAASCVSA